MLPGFRRASIVILHTITYPIVNCHNWEQLIFIIAVIAICLYRDNMIKLPLPYTRNGTQCVNRYDITIPYQMFNLDNEIKNRRGLYFISMVLIINSLQSILYNSTCHFVNQNCTFKMKVNVMDETSKLLLICTCV